MVNSLVNVDKRLDQMLTESPAEAIRLIHQEYQIATDKQLFVQALAAKLVLNHARGLFK